MSTFGFLALQDLKKFKNYIVEIKKKPWKALIYIFYLLWFGGMIYFSLTSNGDIKEIPQIEFKRDIVSSIIKLLVVLLFTTTLYSASKKFEAGFSMGDVNFLFPSPMSPRKILGYAMVKQSLTAGILSAFMLFILPLASNFIGPFSSLSIAYSFVGLVVLFIFTVPFSYLTFILASRFGLKDWVSGFLYGIFGFILALMIYGISTQGTVLQGIFWALDLPSFSYIPIIGWSSELINILITGPTALSPVFLILQVGIIGLVSFLALYFAQDYYEDALPFAERMARIKRVKKEGGNLSFKDLTGKEDSKKKVRNLQVKEVGRGPWAFLWMKLVAGKRVDGSMLLNWKTLGILLISILGGIFSPVKDGEVYLFLSGAAAYILFLSSSAVSIDGELQKKYIFILPGTPWKKILALNIIPVGQSMLFLSLLFLPLGLIFQISFMDLLAGLLFPISMVVLNLFSSTVIHILIPSKFDLKAFFPIIRILGFLLFLIPPGIAGIAVGVFTLNIALGFFTVAIINFAMSVLFLGISNMLFERLEIR